MAIRTFDTLPPRPPGRPPKPPKPRAARPPGRPSKSAVRGLIPAAARPPERSLTVAEEDLSADAVETFARAVGGRAALIDALAIADVNGQADRVINILLDPRYNSWSLRKICTSAGITVADLFAAYKKAALAKAHIEATHLIAGKLVPVVEDVMTRAAPVELVCPSCEGKPSKAKGEPCLSCKGSGLVRSEPDLDRQKLALELGHLTEKRAGLIVQQNQGVLAPAALAISGGGALEQLHQAVGELLFSPTRRRASSPVLDPPVAPVSPHQEPPGDLPLPRQEPDDPDDPDDPDQPEDEEEDEPEGDEKDDHAVVVVDITPTD